MFGGALHLQVPHTGCLISTKRQPVYPNKLRLSPVRALLDYGELISWQVAHALKGENNLRIISSAPSSGPPCQHSLTLGGSTQVGKASSQGSFLSPVIEFHHSQSHLQGSLKIIRISSEIRVWPPLTLQPQLPDLFWFFF